MEHSWKPDLSSFQDSSETGFSWYSSKPYPFCEIYQKNIAREIQRNRGPRGRAYEEELNLLARYVINE